MATSTIKHPEERPTGMAAMTLDGTETEIVKTLDNGDMVFLTLDRKGRIEISYTPMGSHDGRHRSYSNDSYYQIQPNGELEQVE